MAQRSDERSGIGCQPGAVNNGRPLNDPSLGGLWPGQVVQALQRLGYGVDRLTEGHWLLDHPTRPSLQIPYHGVRAVAPDLLVVQLRRAGLSPSKFGAELDP